MSVCNKFYMFYSSIRYKFILDKEYKCGNILFKKIKYFINYNEDDMYYIFADQIFNLQ